MKPETSSRTASKSWSESFRHAMTEAFSSAESADFMSSISELMKVYGIVNLSRDTGIDRITLWRFMRGDRLPRLDTLQKILTALGIKVQFSFEGRMKNFIEYTYWRRQWEAENHKPSTKAEEAAAS